MVTKITVFETSRRRGRASPPVDFYILRQSLWPGGGVG